MPDPTHITLHVFVRNVKKPIFCAALSGSEREASIRYTTVPDGACDVWDHSVTPEGSGIWWAASWRCAVSRAMEIQEAVAGSEAWFVGYDDDGVLRTDNLQAYEVPVPLGPTLTHAATALGLTRTVNDPS